MKNIFKTFSISGLSLRLPFHVTGKLEWNAEARHPSSLEIKVSTKESLFFLLSARL